MRQAIIRTLCYADVFNYPLTIGEIHLYLITNKPTSKKSLTLTLNTLVSKQLISRYGSGVGDTPPLFSLRGRESLFALRHKKLKHSLQKTKISRRVGQWLKKIPSLKAVYITGALAVNNVTKNDDIDLMIITKNNQLWTSRLFSTILLETMQIRRKPQQKSALIRDKLCPNLYLDESSLSLNLSRRNLYTAHEVVQAKLLWQKNDVHNQFLNANRWVSQFLPNTPLPKPTPSSTSIKSSPIVPSKIIESISYSFQTWYMKRHLTTETISPHAAFFHPRDTKTIVLTKYHHRLKKYRVKPLNCQQLTRSF